MMFKWPFLYYVHEDKQIRKHVSDQLCRPNLLSLFFIPPLLVFCDVTLLTDCICWYISLNENDWMNGIPNYVWEGGRVYPPSQCKMFKGGVWMYETHLCVSAGWTRVFFGSLLCDAFLSLRALTGRNWLLPGRVHLACQRLNSGDSSPGNPPFPGNTCLSKRVILW